MTDWIEEYKEHYRQGIYDMSKPRYVFPKGICIFCKDPISWQERQPPPGYLTARAGHAQCYENFILEVTPTCIACKKDIRHKAELQVRYPRDLLHRLCSNNSCIANFAYVCACVHGLPQKHYPHLPEVVLDDIQDHTTDCEFEEVVENRGQQAISYQKQTTVNDFIRQVGDNRKQKAAIRVR